VTRSGRRGGAGLAEIVCSQSVCRVQHSAVRMHAGVCASLNCHAAGRRARSGKRVRHRLRARASRRRTRSRGRGASGETLTMHMGRADDVAVCGRMERTRRPGARGQPELRSFVLSQVSVCSIARAQYPICSASASAFFLIFILLYFSYSYAIRFYLYV
jgi:hypothetical protein